MNVFLRLTKASLALACLAVPVQAKAADWVYLDLGEVIVTGNPTDGYTYVPGALGLLQGLRDAGLKLALMSNIPESWGVSCELKLSALKEFLGGRLNEPDAFDWARFDAIVLPPFDRYRKPHKFMFMHGLQNACPDRAIFIGENNGEIDVAKSLGFATFHKDHGVDLPTVETVKQAIETDFSFAHPADCGFDALYEEIVLPADIGNVLGCAAIP